MSELQKFVKKQTDKFPNISSRKIYGLDSFYLREKPFIVISRNGHIVIKVEDFEVRNNILKIPQVTEWMLDDKVMENWFVLPTTFNKKKSKLIPVLEMVSKALLYPRKDKKKRIKKTKVQKQVPLEKENMKIDHSTSMIKRIFRFFT